MLSKILKVVLIYFTFLKKSSDKFLLPIYRWKLKIYVLEVFFNGLFFLKFTPIRVFLFIYFLKVIILLKFLKV